jgi:gliding motility-associated-like protein
LGDEEINDFTVEIPISYAATYITATAEYFEGITGADPDLSFSGSEESGGLLIWHIGTLPIQQEPNTLLARLTYVLEATTDCFLVANNNCNISIDLNASSSGVGAFSNSSFSNFPAIQGYFDFDECQGFPNHLPILLSLAGAGEYAAQFCNDTPQVHQFEFCNPSSALSVFANVASYFPAGSQFFDQIDAETGQPVQGATEFNSQTGFPVNPGDNVFFAKPPDTGSCFWPFTISLGFLDVQNPPSLTVCFGQEISLVHATSGVTGFNEPINLPSGLLCTYDNSTISITGVSSQFGIFFYSIPLIGDCDGFFAEGTIFIQEPVIGGQIGSDQTIGRGARPSLLFSIEDSSGSGEISYFWEKSTRGPTDGFSQIPNSFEASYHPEPLVESAWFRRVAISDHNELECYGLSNTIMIFVEDDVLIRVPEGFTPDDDFINDTWVIANLTEFYPENLVKVFNRYGSLVFEASPYENDWDGRPNRGIGSTNRNNKLPAGVYFYLIWVTPDSTPLSGFVIIFY